MRKTFFSLVTIFIFAVAFGNFYPTQAQIRDYRVSDTQVRNLLIRIESRTDSFRREFGRVLNTNRANDRQLNETLAEFVTEFENATDNLRRNFDSRNSTRRDVEDVMNRARFINQFIQTNRISVGTQNQWNLIRADLNTLSNYYDVRWNWEGSVINNPNQNNTALAYYVSDAQMESLFVRIEQRSDNFRREVDRSFRNDNTVTQYVSDFENATDSLKRNFQERDSVAADVEEVLRRASVIENYFRANRVNFAASRQWNLLRGDLNTLASYYRVSWDWNNPTMAVGAFDNRLTGTYRLNINQSDNVSDVVRRAVTNGNYNMNQQDRIQRNLERRLTSPDMLAISKTGRQVMLSSSMSPQVTLEADGVTKYETSNNNRQVGVKTTATSADLTISYEGDRMNDFYVTFMPQANGQLRVSRRIYLENRNTTVTVNSVYDKIDQVARWENVNWNQNNGGNNTNVNDTFIIPNNTRLTATLDNPISTKTARDGDTFTMQVTSPNEYRGATIQGRVIGEKSGVVSGRANLSLSFDTIRMSDGRTYRFAGLVEQVLDPKGNKVSVNNEGTVRDGNQTTKTVTRAGIGAALGALIGAIAGGGQGAAIGAAIGAGAGAGTVVLQGRDNLELQSGTEFTINASAPANVRANQ